MQNELLPVARRDPYVLRTNNYEILDGRGRKLPITAASVKLVEARKAWIRQLPGGTNALGQVKFMFPNEFDVYLHDTPVKRDFLATRRDASHGCIRVADPAALAQLLLRDQAQWTPDAIATAMRGRTTQRVALAQSVPVHLVYATAVARPDGTVAFLEDIYGLNDALATTLATPRASGQTAP
ncbi:MAG: L,D-transpeptidase family protein [Gemmatimonadaceae bacterium]|nr:L,D-transpeptidase family protein [Gemmatimonadaceae bacterium]